MAAAPGDVYTLKLVGSVFGQRIMTTTCWIITQVSGVVAEATARAGLVDAARGGAGGGDLLETPYLELLPPQYLMSYFEAQLIRPFRLAYSRTTRAVPGAHASPTEATNQAATITRKSDFAGRWAQSTLHIGPIPQANTVQDDGLIAVAYKAKLELFGAATLTPIIAAGCTFEACIVHPVGVHGGTTPLLTQTIGETVRVMRRRTVRLGE